MGSQQGDERDVRTRDLMGPRTGQNEDLGHWKCQELFRETEEPVYNKRKMSL